MVCGARHQRDQKICLIQRRPQVTPTAVIQLLVMLNKTGSIYELIRPTNEGFV